MAHFLVRAATQPGNINDGKLEGTGGYTSQRAYCAKLGGYFIFDLGADISLPVTRFRFANSNESGNVSVGCTKWKLEGSNDGSLVWDMLLDNRSGYLINNNQRAPWSAAPADSAEASNFIHDLTFYHIPRQSEMLVLVILRLMVIWWV